MMKRILFDCDNTMGLEKKDVDDGLVLLYLLGREDIRLEGITTTFGNGTLEQANQVTTQMLKDFVMRELPFYSGAKDKEDLDTAAAKFLVQVARENKGELTLLATGPLTNLKAAYKLDSNFFSYLKELVIMGGVTKPLCFKGKEVKELNFSCDPQATKLVLEANLPVMLATGNLCLEAFFGPQDWARVESMESDYIKNKIKDWYFYGEELINRQGFYMWDLVSALYITHPNIFSDQYYRLQSRVEDLTTGQVLLKPADRKAKTEEGIINIPSTIKDIDQFKDAIFRAWIDF
ncbi:Inosine-uridine nucleoside N-ribohydrolase [Halobacteroides halobius DSM 5150]|uniref:Inosine-uridine nucleoside N-ribohydrolase n=1 Tax=Halobacteroides halobius (strain ATCC 35273 / DSM 5150 / MD-1) TaxID=748449 RepID=L0K7W4_HALHC|nr:nucleoside hydrolase [Halobacteroides halobius]AGB41116.1 Inosine-uridine nucleoside N-ribohydrolase [Halobacteroides halobius DSM 5150]